MGDIGAKAMSSGVIFRQGPGQLLKTPWPRGCRDPRASRRGQLPQPRFSTAVSSSPKYSADRAGIAKHSLPPPKAV